MSWLELDDGILDHPKFIRAVKLGGGDAVHLWLGLRAYCGKLLTDGFVPEDMLDEVRGPTPGKRRDAALDALRKARLIDEAEGGIQMHNYLKWSKSREWVLKQRDAARERQAKFRGGNGGSNGGGHGGSNGVTPALVTLPSPHHTSPTPKTTPTTREPVVVDDDRETICPADIVARLEAAGVYTELSERFGVPASALREEAEKTAGYWLAGAGMGKRRRGWPARFRQRLVEKAQAGELQKAESGHYKTPAGEENPLQRAKRLAGFS